MHNLLDDDSVLDPFPDLKELFEYWRERRGARIAPAWPDIDMMAFPLNLVPRCLVIDILAEEDDYRYRFWGSGLYEIHGEDLTGTQLSEMALDGGPELLREQYALVKARAAPLYFVNQLNSLKGFVLTSNTMRLPLSSDGETIDKLITAVEVDYPSGAWNAQTRQAKGFVEPQ